MIDMGHATAMGIGHLVPARVGVSASHKASSLLGIAIKIAAAIEFGSTSRDAYRPGLKVRFELRSHWCPTSLLAVAPGLFRGKVRAIQVDALDRRQARIAGSDRRIAGSDRRIAGSDRRIDRLDHANNRLVRTGRCGWKKSRRAVSQMGFASRSDSVSQLW